MNKKRIISTFLIGTTLSVLGAIVLFSGYALIEPTQISAVATTSSVTLTVGEEISLTVSGATALTPAINSTQDTSVGNSTWTVKTNSTDGYTLEFTTAEANALKSGTDTFTDVTTTTPVAWAEDAADYIWGYSAYGDDVATSTWGDAVACGTAEAASFTTSLLYAGFETSTATTDAASSAAATDQDGADTVLCIAAEQGENVFAPSGSYATTVTGTATVQ